MPVCLCVPLIFSSSMLSVLMLINWLPQHIHIHVFKKYESIGAYGMQGDGSRMHCVDVQGKMPLTVPEDTGKSILLIPQQTFYRH
jgi:hypothetical protein